MRVFFSVGEPSGDLHGANLVRELLKRNPNCECVGYGGPRMARAGCRLDADLTELAVMWFLRALLNLPKFWRLLWAADEQFRTQPPDAVVLIDYPGFNWWIARRAKAHKIPVFYYGAPQMWAWASWRIHKMRRLVDHVLCKLPFEATWYAARGCRAVYVGHPYFDEVHHHMLNADFLREQRAQRERLVTLLPGSRTQEVTANINAFLRTAEAVQRRCSNVRFAIASFNAAQAEIAQAQVQQSHLKIPVYVDRTPELIHHAEVCLACSGSVSLELLAHEKPTVIHYRISRLAFFVQRYFRKVKYITLVNLLAADDIQCERGEQYDRHRDHVPFPEYLTCQDESETMAAHLETWLSDESAMAEAKAQLSQLRHEFARPGATERAATYLFEQLAKRKTVPTHPHSEKRTDRQDDTAAA